MGSNQMKNINKNQLICKQDEKQCNNLNINKSNLIEESNWNEEQEDFIILPKQELNKISEQTQLQVCMQKNNKKYKKPQIGYLNKKKEQTLKKLKEMHIINDENDENEEKSKFRHLSSIQIQKSQKQQFKGPFYTRNYHIVKKNTIQQETISKLKQQNCINGNKSNKLF